MVCPNCCQEFIKTDYRQRFCSRSCANSYNNIKYPKRKKRNKFCLICGAQCHGNAGTLFCSHTCAQEQRYRDYKNRWLDGEESGGGPDRVSPYVKRFLLEECRDQCSRCGWSEINPVTKKSPLQVDHVDGDWNNHRRENLRILCPNCHSLTPTFGGLNRGKGRKYRRDQYRKVSELRLN